MARAGLDRGSGIGQAKVGFQPLNQVATGAGAVSDYVQADERSIAGWQFRGDVDMRGAEVIGHADDEQLANTGVPFQLDQHLPTDKRGVILRAAFNKHVVEDRRNDCLACHRLRSANRLAASSSIRWRS